MSSPLFILICSSILLYSTDAARWSWGHFADFKMPSEENKDDCLNGQCLQAWKCPENATVLQVKTACSKRKDGPWVCCIEYTETTVVHSTEDRTFTTMSLIELLSKNSLGSNISTSKSSNLILDISEENKVNNDSGFRSPLEYRHKAGIDNWGRSLTDSPKPLHTEDTSPSPEEYRYNADIVNWGRSYVISPKNSQGENVNSKPSSTNVIKPTSRKRSDKSSTPNLLSRFTEEKWNHPDSLDHRNKPTPEAWHDPHAGRGWSKVTKEISDINRDSGSSRRNTPKTTPRSRWESTKESWGADGIGSKKTQAWEVRTTASSRVKPTKASWDWDLPSSSERTTKTRGVGTTARSPMKPTKESWDHTSSSPRSTKTTTASSWVKPTKDSWSWGHSPSSVSKIANINQGRSTIPTRKPTPTNGRSTGSTKVTPAYPGRQGVHSYSTTQASSLTRFSSRSTKRPVVNLEKPKSTSDTSRVNSTPRRSTTKRYSSTTPMPDINIHQCGLRQTARERSSRGKRSSDPEAVVYAGQLDHVVSIPILNDINNIRIMQALQRLRRTARLSRELWVVKKQNPSHGRGWLPCTELLSPVATGFPGWGLINEKFFSSPPAPSLPPGRGSEVKYVCVITLYFIHLITSSERLFREEQDSSFVVMLGTHTAKESVAEHVVMYVLRHPSYQQRYYYHDIALLRLERPVVFNNYVMPVCLPSPSLPLMDDEDLEGKKVTVMGWGDQSFGGKTSRVLKEASFPIVSRQSCNSSYFRVASNRFPRGIIASMLCAGAPNGGKDACQGDSGGPLTTVQSGRHTQVGIVSFGYKCGDKEYPGVYTKVAPYLTWIAQNARCDDPITVTRIIIPDEEVEGCSCLYW
ncbi:clotting factor B [Trichonephila inaurata madagascariensis]|uniref:Vitamin K-dependent protein C n=1 Tax=Trichonephila inaurata madagascariensis TaxID=2747483 RepID=A0A8X6X9A4_9ARAC|nr:clotting factor B [Trichonephila inaurata madagascariensis]